MNQFRPVRTMGTPLDTEPASGGTINILGVVEVIWRRKLIILACTVMTMGGAWLALKRVTPVYTATSILLLDSRQPNVTNVRGVVSELSLTSSVVAGELAILRSNVLIGEVVDELDLMDHPQFAAPPPKEDSGGGIGKALSAWSDRIVAMLSGLKSETPAPTPEEIATAAALAVPAPAATPADDGRNLVVQKIQNGLSVEQGGISYAIHVSMKSPDPDTAAMIANAVADRYIASQIDEKRALTRRANVWLGERIDRLKTQVEEAEANVVAFKTSLTADGGGVEITQQRLAEINSEMVRASSDRVVAEARLSQVERLVERGGLEAASAALSSPLILTLNQQLSELQRKNAELRKWFGESHPDVVAVTAELADVDRSIKVEIQKTMEGLRSQVEVETAREAQLGASLKEVERRLMELSKTSVELRQLDRFADATRSVYENFLARYNETSEQAEIQRADARVISTAEPPTSPSHPRKKLIMAAATVFGLAIGLAIMFVVELVWRPVRTAQELQARTGITIFGSLPATPGSRRRWAARHAWPQTPTLYSDAIRSLRASLRITSVDGRGQVLLLTSANPGDGKSTTSVALASAFQAIGRTSVIVDCDLYRPSISDIVFPSRWLGSGKRDCLVDYLEGGAMLDDVIMVERHSGISIVAPRKGSPHSADLIASIRFEQLLDELTARFDIVLIDTPPITSFSETRVAAGLADTAVLLVRAGKTSMKAAKAALAILRSSDVPMTGAVLTQARRKTQPADGYGGYHRA